MISSLPRREREIFEILCNLGEGTVADVRNGMTDPPSYTAVRTMLGRLEAKGLVSHRAVDQAYVYKSVAQPAKVRESVLQQLVKTFFEGSAVSAATALLGLTRKLEAEELEALQRAIDEAKERQS
ncbi:MAG: BlaI/MecI/CopY family transcriptional regulator [Pseudomonadota bacterium]|nr:BlaI/MecI/CopY family transcriptional regulator [Pseudomonadota bacterium]